MARTAEEAAGPAPGRARSGFAEAPEWPFDDPASCLDQTRVHAVLEAARRAGMLDAKTARIGGRVSPTLLDQAKLRTGIVSDSELIEFALASVALDDDFAAVLRRVRGTVDPDIPLGY